MYLYHQNLYRDYELFAEIRQYAYMFDIDKNTNIEAKSLSLINYYLDIAPKQHLNTQEFCKQDLNFKFFKKDKSLKVFMNDINNINFSLKFLGI